MKVKKILLIDDEEDFCFFIKTNLELIEHYKVITATNGKKGLKEARHQILDLILLDLMMPGISGFKVLKKLREHSKTKSIPVIILTAKDDEESRRQASSLSISDYIVKPFQIKKLKSKIEGVFANRKKSTI